MQPTISSKLSALNDWFSLEKERKRKKKEEKERGKNRKGDIDEERKE